MAFPTAHAVGYLLTPLPGLIEIWVDYSFPELPVCVRLPLGGIARFAMEPSSTPSKPAPAAAARAHAEHQNESSPATASQPTKAGTEHVLPRQVIVAALIVAAALPALLLGALFTLMIAANYNLLNWME